MAVVLLAAWLLGVALAAPPSLNITAPDYQINTGENFYLGCAGDREIAWTHFMGGKPQVCRPRGLFSARV
jgi:hypothetical protein